MRLPTLVTDGRPALALNAALAVLVAIAAAVYHPLLLPWMMTWGATATEAGMALPGDELAPQPTFQSTRAVTIAAPPERIWPWLVQIGQDRGGFYSYDWMENLVGAGIHNADRIAPEWQHRVHGDFVPSLRPDYARGTVRDIAGWRVGWIETNRGLALVGWGSFVLLPIDDGHTRLVIRTRTVTAPGAFSSRFADLLFGRPLHFVMERRMLLGIQERVEGTAFGPAAVLAATFGFLLASMLTSWYLLRTGEAAWLFLALAIAVAVMQGADDPRAALVGVTATSLITLGLLRLRHWWAVDAGAVALVLLLLLIARDAYVTIGLGLLCVAALTSAAAARRAPAAAAGYLPDGPSEDEADDHDEEQRQQPAHHADGERARDVTIVERLADRDEHRHQGRVRTARSPPYASARTSRPDSGSGRG